MLPSWACDGHVPVHRWGEAKHPGPSAAADDLLWISFSNPSGLRNKESIALAMGEGIHNFSETHLSWQTQKSCSHDEVDLLLLSIGIYESTMGSPVAVRAHSTWAGAWSGVATLSDQASFEVALPYNGKGECGRLLTTRHILGRSSLLNVVAYGFPSGPSWPQSI